MVTTLYYNKAMLIFVIHRFIGLIHSALNYTGCAVSSDLLNSDSESLSLSPSHYTCCTCHIWFTKEPVHRHSKIGLQWSCMSDLVVDNRCCRNSITSLLHHHINTLMPMTQMISCKKKSLSSVLHQVHYWPEEINWSWICPYGATAQRSMCCVRLQSTYTLASCWSAVHIAVLMNNACPSGDNYLQ